MGTLSYRFLMLALGYLSYPFFFASSRGRYRLKERYGFWPFSLPTNQSIVWFHGASLGETQSVAELLPFFKSKFPSSFFLHTSVSNYAEKIGKELFDGSAFLPFDSKKFLKQALKNSTIKLLIICETELWPELIRFVKNQGGKVLIINGRISDTTVNRYRVLAPFLRDVVKAISLACVIDRASKDRYANLGIPNNRIIITGNTKYDRKPSITSKEEATVYAHTIFSTPKSIITLGSIRPQEEKIWFDPIREIMSKYHDLQLIVAPRHKEKFEYFENALSNAGLSAVRFTTLKAEKRPANDNERIVLLDTFGELERVYSYSSLVFIGASLVPIGGHNPLEAAAYRVPVVMGPHSFTVGEIVSDLKKTNGIIEITNQLGATEVLRKLVECPEALKNI
jgi:3-deoxy-D-manno-octulosonic-acid transferase